MSAMAGWIWLRAGRARLDGAACHCVRGYCPLVFLDWFRILRQIPVWWFWKCELVALIGIEAAYGAGPGGEHPGHSRASVALYCGSEAWPGTALGSCAGCSAAFTLFWDACGSGRGCCPLRENHRTRMPILAGATDQSETRENPMGRVPLGGERVGLHERFPDETNDGVTDLVVLGESSAEGVPFQKWLSIGGLVKWQLEESIGELNVRLTILAHSGDTLANQHEALAGLKRRPEILIVYCGHNEFSSRFFALRDLPYYFLDQRGGAMGLVRRRSRATLTCMRSDRPINRSMPDCPATAADRASARGRAGLHAARNTGEFSTIFDTGWNRSSRTRTVWVHS